MRWQEVPVVGGAYSDDAKPFSVQDTVNWIPEMAERPGGRSPALLRSAPGLVAMNSTLSGAVRGLHDVEGLLLAVVGQTLYRVSAEGVLTTIGTIPGVRRVSMAHNQITGGSEVVIANGQNGYVYDTTDDTLTQITDEGFPGAKVVGFVDGYIVGVEPMGRYWFHSDLADASSYNTLDRSEAEAQPDRIVTLIVSHRDVLVFGERSAEFFYNTGEATGTFQRRDGTEMEVGCAGTHAVARVDNSVLFMGHDGSFYRLDGYSPVRISTHAIEQAVSRFNWRECFAFVYEDRGHKIVYWTFPDGQTFGFDVATQEWHRRESKGLTRWRLNALVRSNRRWVGGDYANGKLYVLDWDTATEDGEEMERRRITGVLHDQQNRVAVNALELVFNTGQPSSTSFTPGLEIVGDLGDGFLGAAVDYTYTVNDPLGNHGPLSITSGAVPSGCTMDSTGRVTGTRSAVEVASWTVYTEGDPNRSDSHADTSETINPATWLLVDNGYKRIGTFTANNWTPLTNVDCQGYAYYVDGQFHLSSQSNSYAISTDQGLTWSTSGPGVSAGGGRVARIGNTLFVCGGVLTVKRMTLGGSWTEIVDSPRANAMVAVGTSLVCASIYDQTSHSSADNGTTWVEGATYGNPGGGFPCLATNGTRVVIVWCETDGTTYTLKTAYSDNLGAAWSSATTLAAVASSTNVPGDVIWDGTRFVVAVTSGAVYHSLDGATWTLSASTVGSVRQMAVGEGAIVAVCDGGIVSWSTDHGVTWSVRTYPADGRNLSGIAWIYE